MDIFKNKYQFLYDSYFGEGGYLNYNNYSYIIKHPKETADDYKGRKIRTMYENYYAPMINIYLTPIFGAKVEIKTNNTNINNAATYGNLIKHSNRAVRDLKMYDQCYYGISFSSDATAPDIFNIIPKDIKEVTVNNNNVLLMEYKEHKIILGKKVPIHCIYKNNGNYNILIKKTMGWLLPDGVVSLEEQAEELRIKTYDDTIEDVWIYKQGHNDLYETPDSNQIATVNLDIHNKRALADNILYTNACSTLVIATDSEVSNITLGNSNILKVPSTVSHMPEYLEISDTNYTIIKNDVDSSKEYLYKMFSNNIMSENVQYTTAVATLLATRSYDEEVNYLYMNYKIIINKLVNRIVEYYGIVTTLDIEFPEISYQIDQIDAQMKTQLNQE